MNELIAKITSNSSVAIRSNDAAEGLDQPLYAVNWFDASPAWLYHLYNKLASRCVIKVGGLPLFKATVNDSLLSDTGKRQILLIVKYPDGNAFKKLLESTYFKLVSLLRIMAVQRFTFSFTQPQGNVQLGESYNYYALHHFDNRGLHKVLPHQTKNGIDVKVLFAGNTFARLHRLSKDKADIPIRNVVDKLIIYGASSQEELENYLLSKEYLSHFDIEKPGYISSLNRIF